MTAFLFDMDGVIIDSTPMHVEAWRVYLQRMGRTAVDIGPRMLGKHNGELVRDFLSISERDEAAIHRHGALKEQVYRDLMSPVLYQHLVPGIGEFLGRHASSPMAIATNAEPANVDFVLNGARLRRYFGAIVDGHTAPRPKPFPDIYLLAADMLGVAPEDCVVFEDSLTGVQAGRSAGCRVVGVSTTLTELPGVDLIIRDFLDPRLEPWLQDLTVCR